jgi:hypothetical protein
MPDLIRHPVPLWIPAYAGMTTLTYLIAGVIAGNLIKLFCCYNNVPIGPYEDPIREYYAESDIKF